MSAAEQRAALDAVGQLALECGEFTWDPDAESDEDDIEALIELGAAELYDDEPLKIIGEYARPATRKPVRLNRRADVVDIPLPPLDDPAPPRCG